MTLTHAPKRKPLKPHLELLETKPCQAILRISSIQDKPLTWHTSNLSMSKNLPAYCWVLMGSTQKTRPFESSRLKADRLETLQHWARFQSRSQGQVANFYSMETKAPTIQFEIIFQVRLIFGGTVFELYSVKTFADDPGMFRTANILQEEIVWTCSMVSPKHQQMVAASIRFLFHLLLLFHSYISNKVVRTCFVPESDLSLSRWNGEMCDEKHFWMIVFWFLANVWKVSCHRAAEINNGPWSKLQVGSLAQRDEWFGSVCGSIQHWNRFKGQVFKREPDPAVPFRFRTYSDRTKPFSRGSEYQNVPHRYQYCWLTAMHQIPRY